MLSRPEIPEQIPSIRGQSPEAPEARATNREGSLVAVQAIQVRSDDTTSLLSDGSSSHVCTFVTSRHILRLSAFVVA